VVALLFTAGSILNFISTLASFSTLPEFSKKPTPELNNTTRFSGRLTPFGSSARAEVASKRAVSATQEQIRWNMSFVLLEKRGLGIVSRSSAGRLLNVINSTS
jgi:hypothetical protein